MEPRIVASRPEHAPFIAWVLLTAHRSHLERGLWDIAIGADEPTCLAFLEALATTREPHWAHWSTFLVAEVDGVPAAALCGYLDEEHGMPAFSKAVPEASAAVGRTAEEQEAGARRTMPILYVAPRHEPGAWIVENVATLPEFRRLGLVQKLIEEILDRGRARGATTADIGILIGNEPAERAYLKAGFRIVDEKRHPDFERVWQCPGIRALSRPI